MKEKLKECPAFQNGKCPFAGDECFAELFQHLYSGDLAKQLHGLAEKCPAFKVCKFSYVKISVAVQLKFLVVLLSLELLLLEACLFDPSRMGAPTKTSQSI